MLNFDDYKNPRILITASIVVTMLVSQILLDLEQVTDFKTEIINWSGNFVMGYLLFIFFYASLLIIITMAGLMLIEKMIADLIK